MSTLINFTTQFEELWKITKVSFEDKDGLYNQIINELKDDANLHHNLEDVDHLKKLDKSFGIYLFQIKPETAYTYESLLEEWDTNARSQQYTKFPRVCKGRFLKSLKENPVEPYAFYIGKSEKLGKRITEHLTHKKDHATYGLKLNGRKIKEQLVYSYWEFPPELESVQVEIKQFLLQRIESHLRNKLKVWIGKQ